MVHALPELGRALPYLAAPLDIDAPAARFRLFDSLASFFKRLARERPLVLLFDDLQQADAMTVSLLAFLARQLERAPVLIAVSVRPLVGIEPARAQPLAALLRLSYFREVELAGLSADEIGTWVRARAGFPIGSRLAQQLHTLSGGNPLLLEHLLEDVRQLSAAERERAQGERFASERLRRPIERHLEQLSERGLGVLRCAALLGDEFSTAALAEVAEQSLATVASELLTAAQLGLIRADARAPQHVFAHALIRAALYAQLPVPERARLHGRAVRVYEEEAKRGRAQLAQLAEHCLRAGPEHDAGRTLPTCLQLARAAWKRGAFEEAVTYYDRALGAAGDDEAHAKLRLECMLEKGEAAAMGREFICARTTLLAAAAAAEAIGDHGSVLRAAMTLGELPESGSVDAECVASIERAIARTAADDPRRVCLQALLSKRLMYGGDRATCARLARTALRACERMQSPQLRARTLRACLSGLVDPTCREDRLAAGKLLERHGHEHGAPGSLIMAACARVQAAVELGDLSSAGSAIETLESVVQRVRDPFALWQAQSYRAMHALLRGQLGRALQLARSAYSRGRPLHAGTVHVYVTQLSSILRLRGRFGLAARAVRHVMVQHPRIAGWQAVLSTLEAEQGRTRHARAVLDRLVEHDLARLHADPYGLSVLAAGADLCSCVGDAEQAVLLYAALEPYAALHGCIGIGIASHGPLSHHLGRLALQCGKLAAAERHLRHAMEAAQAMGSPQFTSASMLAYAHLRLTTGEPNAGVRAMRLVARAEAIAEAHGMHGFRHHCAALRAYCARSRSA